MTVRYEITGSVANGDYLSPAMDAGFGQCELSSIRFFNAGGAQVTPTAGSITFSGTPDGVNYRQITNGTFLAADAYKFERTPPFAEGLMVQAKIGLTGVTGANTFVALVWRS